MHIQSSALRHGVSVEDIAHAWAFAIGIVNLESGHEPPKRLSIGPDRAGNLLEIVYLEATGEDSAGDDVIIHAMPLRTGLAVYLRRQRP
ncbi:hypothetical protein [Candidatus Poriferisodalis sp.]|uniref:hypothetical protein n=1 Tax=Candidatus Poriferisodalis sp. TaxID=3101277 RepID=UPI003B026A73